MAQFITEPILELFNLSKINITQFDYTVNPLFSLVLVRDMTMATDINRVIKGELHPIAIRVTPVSEEYENFTILEEGTSVIIRNSRGNEVRVVGELSIDANNQTVLFAWDTSSTAYPIDQYTITMWISLEYNNTRFRMISNSISRSLRQESVLQ